MNSRRIFLNSIVTIPMQLLFASVTIVGCKNKSTSISITPPPELSPPISCPINTFSIDQNSPFKRRYDSNIWFFYDALAENEKVELLNKLLSIASYVRKIEGSDDPFNPHKTHVIEISIIDPVPESIYKSISLEEFNYISSQIMTSSLTKNGYISELEDMINDNCERPNKQH